MIQVGGILMISQVQCAAEVFNVPQYYTPYYYPKLCWAASSQSILSYYGKSVPTQWEMVNFLGIDYREDVANAYQIRNNLNHWGVGGTAVARPLSVAEIYTEINNERPFIIVLAWQGEETWTVVGEGIEDGYDWEGNPAYGLFFCDPDSMMGGHYVAIYEWVRDNFVGKGTWQGTWGGGGEPTPSYHRPTIEIIPAPDGTDFEFQRTILDGNSFAIRVTDEDGTDDLDIATFRVYNYGLDITEHFVNTFRSLYPSIDSNADSRTYTITVDPQKFMDEHDLFCVLYNGYSHIRFEISDSFGLQGSKEYLIYFGPFLYADYFHDLGENGGLKLRNVYLGNTGLDSPDTELFIALQKGEDYWSFALLPGASAFYWNKNTMDPCRADMELETGYKLYLPEFSFNCREESYQNPLETGTYQLYLGAVDRGYGVYRLHSMPATLWYIGE